LNWWDILKSAKGSSKVSSKGKGTTFDASKIKVNIKDDESCVEKYNKIYDYINREFKRIKESTSLKTDKTGERIGEQSSNVWTWFAFSDKDLRDASSATGDTYKVLAEMEYDNFPAKNEELACKQLKLLSNAQFNLNKNSQDARTWLSFYRSIYTYQYSLRSDDVDGGTIQMRFSIVNPEIHEYYRKKVQMKPSLKGELMKLADSFDNLFKTVIQMAKDAVREKGL
jgi:hypothetical protein